uniref:Growth arrest and DNA-damage-inducible, beta b n=1 Tax=Fundulus heteroclitus TaxID=8078 RepID=A0A3Q2NRN6_FUNHE
METVSQALEELLVAAQRQDCLTVGVYESAKLMNVDPDSVVLCLLATDEEDEDDIALQIHFTLLQAFCCDNDINILRVSGMRRLSKLLGEDTDDSNGNEPRDLHCILVTVSARSPFQPACVDQRGRVAVFVSLTACPVALLQNPPVQPLQCQALQDVSSFCEESRCRNQWVPCLELQDG